MHDEWAQETLWIEMERAALYPPRQLLKVPSARELLRDLDLDGKDVLDDGCGTGWFGAMAARRGARVTGTDLSETLLETASRVIPTRHASCYDLPFRDETFDYALSLMVLHILDDPGKALAEARRVLRPGGGLILGVVHPGAERWDLGSGRCYADLATSSRPEERPWVFNLTDGRGFAKRYRHRPMDFYETLIADGFTVRRRLEPTMPEPMRENGLYARREFLFLSLQKK